MDDVLPRLLVILVITATALGAAFATRRWQRPGHPPIELDDQAFEPGIVMFTSTDCPTCKDALDAVRKLDVPLREVTWELEGRVLEALGVATVPLTVFVGPGGESLDQIVGVPRSRRLAKAVATWRTAVAA